MIDNYNLCTTETVAHFLNMDIVFRVQVFDAIEQFKTGIWGNIPKEEKEENNANLKAHKGEILARYNTNIGDINIFSEFKSKSALIMFSGEL